MVNWARPELLAVLGALVAQATTSLEGTAAVERASDEPEDVVEIKEFLSGDCEGPPARLWHIQPGSSMQCLNLRPRMATPGQAAVKVSGQDLYGRVSCSSLREPEGGFLELCSDRSCSQEGCQKVSIVQEGSCGFSFTGFAAASWRCIKASEMPEGSA
eukprot:TRINITY_DN15458_c0_g1_i1.p1 TRINITY_DN15458_c0_g1~~TRINITY_DN15458_c0_g1_i1.p1  ORF type:complete len:158 (+),score=31.45 TRINITY_DN15458_c0_g1_i1:84-557(+)